MITIEEIIPVEYTSVGELHGNIAEALNSVQECILTQGTTDDCRLFCSTQSLMVSLLMKQIHGYQCSERYRKLQVRGLIQNLQKLSTAFPSQSAKLKTSIGYFETLLQC